MKKLLKVLFKVNKQYDAPQEVIEYKINKRPCNLSRADISYKYKFDKSVKLKGKYLERYNNFLSYKLFDEHLSKLYESGFYEYQYKLKQYLSECGINRLVYNATSNVHIILNNIVLSSKLRNRFIQLIINYGIDNNFFKMIDTINSSSYDLIKTIDTNEKNIFNHLITILYKVLCSSGIRNTQNMSVLNLSINMHKLKDTKIETNDPKEIQKLLFANFSYIFDNLVIIFNKHIDKNKHIEKKDKYCYMNDNNVNNFTLTFVDKKTYSIQPNMYEKIDIVNINITMDDNKYVSFTSANPYNIDNLDNVHFLNVYFAYIYDTLLDEIVCNINDKKTIFKLDTSILVIMYKRNNIKYNIYMNCFICNDKYFIHDMYLDLYFKIDWRTRDIKNYYNIFTAIYLENVIAVYHTNITYYNSHFDFTYDITKCQPKRIL